MSDLSAALKAAMKSQKTTRRAFADLLGLSPAGLYRLLSGGTPRIATIRKLKQAGVRIPKSLLAA